ncbi:MAG: JAB domain-containing protein [Nitrospira sp.]|nr:JAB domain-containing protein [Nitrospira sp.]MDH5725737.1 JAB domain-containing protein [Nitrospira sp.]
MKTPARLAAAANRPSTSIGTAEPYRAPRYRVTLVCETEGTGTAEPIRDSSTAVQLFRPCFEGLDREHFVVCGLDAKHRVIGINVVSVGSLTLSIVHPREVLKPLIVMNAAAWLCRVRMRPCSRTLP